MWLDLVESSRAFVGCASAIRFNSSGSSRAGHQLWLYIQLECAGWTLLGLDRDDKLFKLFKTRKVTREQLYISSEFDSFPSF